MVETLFFYCSSSWLLVSIWFFTRTTDKSIDAWFIRKDIVNYVKDVNA